jgi:hypothetical protein
MVTLVKNQITNRNMKMRQNSATSNETKTETVDLNSNLNDHNDYEIENKLVKISSRKQRL